MEDNFNKHLGNKLKLRRLALRFNSNKSSKSNQRNISTNSKI